MITSPERVRTSMSRAGLPSMVAVIIGILCVTTACNDYALLGDEDMSSSSSYVSLKMRVSSTGTSEGDVYEYEVGTIYENWIDISGGDYKIYFFTNDPANDGNDKFIAEFKPTDLSALSGTSYTEYSMFGPVPDELLELSDFKIVMLANWGGSYTTPTAETTIDDVCNSGLFGYKTNFVLSGTNLIPFYGVSEYEGIDFTANEITTLPEPINLVRAMAKVEVVLETDGLVFESVVLHRYNSTGYCAPSGVYTRSDYTVHPTGWNYVDDGFDLHLPNGGSNDTDTDDRELEMQLTQNDDGLYTWYCYVPEYRNTTDSGLATQGSAEDYAYIQVNLYGYELDLEDYRIYFRNYDDEGTADPGADYDIGRNVLYRFTVTLSGQWLNVHVDKWEDSFWNDFTFSETIEDE